MSEHEPAGEQPKTFHICTGAMTVGEFLRSQGTYRYEREDGTIVHGDASGEWTLDENGDLRTSSSSPPRARWGTGGRPSSGTPSPRDVLRRWGMLDQGAARTRPPLSLARTRTHAKQKASRHSHPHPLDAKDGRGLVAGDCDG